MASNLTISVGADVTDLRTKMALAQVSFRDAQAELRRLATGFKSAADSAKSALLPGLQSAATAAAGFKAQISSATAELKKHSAAHKEAGGILGANRSTFLELGHSARAMADGLAAGIDPIRLIAMEAPRATQALLEMNGVSIGQIAKWGALAGVIIGAAGALAYYATEALRVGSMSRDLSAGLNAQGIGISEDAISKATTYLHRWTDLSVDDIKTVVTQISKVPGATDEMVEAIARIAPEWSKMRNVTPAKGVEELTDAMADLSGKGAVLMDSLHPGVDAMNAFGEAARTSSKAAESMMLTKVMDSLKQYTTDLRSAKVEHRSLAEVFDEAGGGEPGPASDPARSDIHGEISAQHVKDQTEEAMKNLDLFRAAIAKMPDMSPSLEAVRTTLDQMAADTTKTHAQIVQDQAAYVNKLLKSDEMQFPERLALQRQYSALTVEAKQKESDEVIRLGKLAADQAAIKAGPDRAAQVAAEIASYKSTLADARLTADAKEELNNQIAELQVQLVRRDATEAKKSTAEIWADFSARMSEQIEAAKGNFTQQIALANQWVAEGQKLYGKDVEHYRAAQAEVIRLTQERVNQQREIEQIRARGEEARAQISAKPDQGEFKASLSLVLDRSKLDAEVQKQIDELTAGAQKKIGDLQASKQGVTDPAQLETVNQEILTQQAQLASQIQGLHEKAAAAVAQSWEKITTPIGGAFDEIVNGLTERNARIGQVAEKAAEGIVVSWVKAGVHVVTDWAAKEIAMTAATETGVAARTAASNTGVLGDLARMALGVDRFLGFETAKTGAAVTGEAARTGAATAAAATGKGVQAVTNATTIAADAAVGAAGAYAATAPIPFVGPELAPAAAATTYGAIMAFEGAAAAEGGFGDVPTDDLPTFLHAREMVLPAKFASPLRDMLTRPTPFGPSQAAAGLAGNVTNRGGDSSFTSSPTVHIHGSGNNADALRAVLKDHTREVARTVAGWQKGGGGKLPGRGI